MREKMKIKLDNHKRSARCTLETANDEERRRRRAKRFLERFSKVVLLLSQWAVESLWSDETNEVHKGRINIIVFCNDSRQRQWKNFEFWNDNNFNEMQL